MSDEYVVIEDQILENFRTFISYRNNKVPELNNFYHEKMRSGKVFVIQIINGSLEFVPSKFIGYRSNSYEIHKKLYNKGRSGTDADAAIHKIYGMERIDDKLDQIINYFFEIHHIQSTPYKSKANLKYLYDNDKLKNILEIGLNKISFFSATDIEKYSVYAGQKYRKDNPTDVINGKEIRDRLFEKTNHWMRQTNYGKFTYKETTKWQINGYFSSYTWSKIVKPEYSDKKIYFTVGVDYQRKALVYKLDCQRKNTTNPNNALSEEQIAIFDELVDGTGAEWQQINLEELKNYNWGKLVRETENFIKEFEPLYEKVINNIWHPNTNEIKTKYVLGIGKFIKPVKHNGQLGLEPTKDGKTDWKKLHEERSALGTAGEEYVIEIEREELLKKGKQTLASEIEHTSKLKGDGFGYDILSYTADKKKKYIEVKTTSGSYKTPIYISSKELLVSKDKDQDYYLYRVYDFDKIAKTGKIKIIQGPIDDTFLEVDGYKATIE